MDTPTNLSRREAIKTMVSSALLCAAGINGFTNSQPAYAMGEAGIPQGVQKVEGDVTINGIPAKVGDIVAPDDVIVTGKDSSIVFVFGDSACLMRENSKMVVKNSDKSAEPSKVINGLRLLDGKLLSVFGEGEKSVETPSAYIGIRGTGIYVESDHEKTYICTCYGKVKISYAHNLSKFESISANYHESSRHVYRDGAIKRAPMINHTDAELIMLERFVNRLPPFAKSSEKRDGGGY
ncbi:MAG: FecR domain-containing protein [Desulfamplus sp.]|nr:FecR domain-containing protein [Desulfamplus sp.]